MFAELLELSLAAGLRLEATLPAYLPTSPTMASPEGAQIADSVLVSTHAPSTVLQHPGYYYYAAADCSVQRKKRFDNILGRMTDPDPTSRTAKTQAAPGLVTEQKIDHTAIILEVSTLRVREVNPITESHMTLDSCSQKLTVISSARTAGRVAWACISPTE